MMPTKNATDRATWAATKASQAKRTRIYVSGRNSVPEEDVREEFVVRMLRGWVCQLGCKKGEKGGVNTPLSP